MLKDKERSSNFISPDDESNGDDDIVIPEPEPKSLIEKREQIEEEDED